MSSVAIPAPPPSTLRLRTRLQQTGIIIPTYNASPHWKQLQAALDRQGIAKEQILILDSSSSDNTAALAKRAGYLLKVIPLEQFQHGATRQLALAQLPWAETLVYLTQDAIPGKNSIQTLLRAFDDAEVGAAYGRQLPRPEADEIEAHARLFNYPPASDVRNFASREQLGFRAAFFSNSFAAYRRSALEEVGGFPTNTIVSEEVTVAARMLIAGWKLAYQAEATVIHSHPLTVRKEFSRYFDIGVHHGRESWLIEQFGGAGGEGLKFVASEMRFLAKNKASLIPLAVVRSASKWCAYKLGSHERHLPLWVKKRVSGQPNFWHSEDQGNGVPLALNLPADR
ncbi:glycosyltransferase family 2 protein [Granulicella sp. WH15]|uniref:glycosyltransferase n=1 Tax=Granulicella sp. WH15 TaxID=2602070 RepID=UPI0013675F72|nr:glycosyltransferase family 2 protein [Granulicella sp. WH15]QHN04327.1 glycosyltransferase family 2 protein [Granulicella sp. WH15]